MTEAEAYFELITGPPLLVREWEHVIDILYWLIERIQGDLPDVPDTERVLPPVLKAMFKGLPDEERVVSVGTFRDLIRKIETYSQRPALCA